MLQVLACLVVILLAIYWALSWNFGYWKKRGVPHPKPSLLWGNLGDAIAMKRCYGQIYNDLYREYEGCAYVGLYKVRQPTIVIRDLELVQNVLIKDFSNFYDTDIEVDPEVDPMMSKNPFCLKGKEWKNVRMQLSPSFTAGKVKPMFEHISKVGEDLVKYIEHELEANGRNGMEAKELASKYTTDVVATVAFGVEGKSFVDPNSEFVDIGRKIISPSFWMGLKHFIVLAMPFLAKLLRVKFISDEVANWFRSTINQILAYRTANNIQRNDFIELMIHLKNKAITGQYEFDNEHIAAHAATFFADGFNTSATALAFTLYELATNQDVQNKARDEIKMVLEKHAGKITYDALQEMSYLENIFLEGLRMHSPVFSISRVCTERYTLPPARGPGTGPNVIIEPGVQVAIPVHAIHYDPNIYTNPHKFDPDRFNEENKNERPKCTYLPFGEGPRICLGMKLGNVQTKAGLVAILSKFVVRINSRTVTPIQHDQRMFLLEAKGGIWLNFYKI